MTGAASGSGVATGILGAMGGMTGSALGSASVAGILGATAGTTGSATGVGTATGLWLRWCWATKRLAPRKSIGVIMSFICGASGSMVTGSRVITSLTFMAVSYAAIRRSKRSHGSAVQVTEVAWPNDRMIITTFAAVASSGASKMSR